MIPRPVRTYILPVLFSGALFCLSAFELHAQQNDTARREKVEKRIVTPEASGTSLDGSFNAPAAPQVRSGGHGADFGSAPAFSSGMASPLGGTIGGAKDIGYARQIIADGRIPGFVDFSPEGLYAEHDIPTPSTLCDASLCLSLGYGFAPAADDRSQALFIHLGMSSNIDAATFHRTPLQIAIVVDRSGSMEGRNMEGVKRALRALVGRLTPEDEIALVAFDSEAELLVPATRMTDTARLFAAIDSIKPDGTTNIEAGLKIGAAQLTSLEKRPGFSRRIVLFTDAMPNAGTVDTAGFRAITARYADEGIGLTVFGVGVDFGQELVYHITRLRGANFYYLDSPEKGEKLITEEFDYMVTPLVYDLKVRIATPAGMRLRAVYGLPSWVPGDRDAELFIPTVFLSSNRGAIILRYERDGAGELALEPGALLADGSLGYTEPSGRRHDEKQELRHRGVVRMDAGTRFYTHDGMRKAVALTNIYFGLRDGCVLNTAGRRKEALEAITRARSLALVENLTLADPGIATEIALLDKLALNIEGR